VRGAGMMMKRVGLVVVRVRTVGAAACCCLLRPGAGWSAAAAGAVRKDGGKYERAAASAVATRYVRAHPNTLMTRENKSACKRERKGPWRWV
jgi:hypothetical protein